VRRSTQLVIILAAAIIVVGGIILLSTVNSQGNEPPAAATFLANGIGASLTRASDKQFFQLEANQLMQVYAGDTLQGSGTLNFNGAQVELAPTAQIVINRYKLGGENQIEINLKTGQVFQQIGEQTAALYTISTAAGSLVARSGKFIAFIDTNGVSQFGAVYGAANVYVGEHSLTLSSGQGTTIAPGNLPTEPIFWSAVRVIAYQPDGSAPTLPVSLISHAGNNQFYFQTGQPVLVPPGTYDLKVIALVDYKVDGLVLSTQDSNEFSVTLGQAVFTTVDETGTEVPYTKLTLSGDQRTSVSPKQAVLLSPGSSTLTVAVDNKPSAVQPIAIDILPGQTATIPLRTALFGGARIKLNITTPDGFTISPMDITVYPAANENGIPVDSFSSDSTSSLLPPGDYVVIVPTDIAGRYPVKIANNQDVSIDAKLGTLTINYKSGIGQATTPLIYVASVSDMQRLNLPIDKMQLTKFGVYARLTRALLVPEGKYDIRVNDPNKVVDINDVEVQSRQNVVQSIDGSTS
jgi:hypothetical protein